MTVLRLKVGYIGGWTVTGTVTIKIKIWKLICGGKKKKKGEYIARGIYFPKYYGKGEGEWLAGEKNEIEELGKN